MPLGYYTYVPTLYIQGKTAMVIGAIFAVFTFGTSLIATGAGAVAYSVGIQVSEFHLSE